MSSINNIETDKIRELFYSILQKIDVTEDVAKYLVEGIVQASLRGIDSHGIRLFPHYLEGFKQGRLNKNPQYKFNKTAASTAKLDGDHAPGHAAGAVGMMKAIELAKETGIGAVSVFNSSHFGVAAYYGFMAADNDMIGLSFTHATAHVLSHGGKRPFFGNNPVCMVAPCEGEEPFCFDMATTVATFNKVQYFKENNQKIPVGWGVDKDGNDTDDPGLVESLLPIGGYKGFGLSMMVEIFCGMLSGAPLGPDVSRMFDMPMDKKRYLGQFFIAINISCFDRPEVFKKRMKEMMDALRREPSLDADVPVKVPGDPEKEISQKRLEEGLPVPKTLLKQLQDLGIKYGVETSF